MVGGRNRSAKRAQETLVSAAQVADSDPRRACNLYLRAARLLSIAGQHRTVADTLVSAATVATASGNLNRALRILRRARTLASRLGDTRLLALALYETASVELKCGSRSRARRFARAALKLYPALPQDPSVDPAVVGVLVRLPLANPEVAS
jgi:ATP/maltotriose-dependent transcriptional regulator MalT